MLARWFQSRTRFARFIILLAVTIGGIGPLTHVPSAQAYVLENVYPAQWTGIRLYEGSIATAIEKQGFESGVTAWTNSGAGVSFTYWGSTSGAEITVKTYSANDGNEAVTYINLTSTICNGWQQTNNAAIQLNDLNIQSYGVGRVQSVAAHELGHALGLDHNTGAVIMNTDGKARYVTYGVTTPQTDDVNGVKAIKSRCGAP